MRGRLFKDGAVTAIAKADLGSIAKFTEPAVSTLDTILNVVPDSIVQSFAQGDILPVLPFSVLFGIGFSLKREATQSAIDTLGSFLHGLFGVMEIVIRLTSIGAFDAMAFTVGKSSPSVSPVESTKGSCLRGERDQ